MVSMSTITTTLSFQNLKRTPTSDRALEQHVVERLSHTFVSIVKHDSAFSWPVRVINTMGRYVSGVVLSEALLIGGQFACITFGEGACHKGLIILVLLRVSFQLFPQPNSALPGLSLVGEFRRLAILKW